MHAGVLVASRFTLVIIKKLIRNLSVLKFIHDSLDDSAIIIKKSLKKKSIIFLGRKAWRNKLTVYRSHRAAESAAVSRLEHPPLMRRGAEINSPEINVGFGHLDLFFSCEKSRFVYTLIRGRSCKKDHFHKGHQLQQLMTPFEWGRTKTKMSIQSKFHLHSRNHHIDYMN